MYDQEGHSNGHEVVNHLKKGHRSRIVSIDDEFVPFVYDYLQKNINRGDSDYLFIRPDGKRMTVSNLNHAMEIVVKNHLNLPMRNIHSIRKTVISRIIQSRLFSQTDIMERAGHISFETTERYYAFALPAENDRTNDLKAALFPGNLMIGPTWSNLVQSCEKEKA